MSTPISAIVITKNEEEMLAGCLGALQWADELLVVDSFSTDRTIGIAQACGAKDHPAIPFRILQRSGISPKHRRSTTGCFSSMPMK